MTAEEDAERIIRLERGQEGYILSENLKKRIISVLGPYKDDQYLPNRDIQKLFIRYRLMQKHATDHDISIGRFEDIVPSFEVKDKETTESNIKAFYLRLGMKEPRLPRKPKAVNNVVEPVRAMYDSDEQYAYAVEHYSEQTEAYQKALKEWEAYEKNYCCPIKIFVRACVRVCACARRVDLEKKACRERIRAGVFTDSNPFG